jgi:hypothetical protein
MANNRIYYACQNVQLNGPSGTAGQKNTGWDSVQGLQSVGMTTNFNLEPVYQLGQLELYDNYEEIPEVEIQLNKVLDNAPTLYSMTMGTGTLSSLANHRCGVRLNLFPDTATVASGTPIAQVTCAPAYLSSVTYTFPTEGNFTEEVTLVSNDKVWSTSVDSNATTFLTNSSPVGRGILRRGLWSKETVLPTGAGGGATGSNSGGIPAGLKLQNVTVSMNLGRESIFNLGDRVPYYRYVNFPVEITCEIEVVANTGDMVGVAGSTNDACSNPKALSNKQIVIKLCDGTVIDLGSKNKLTSVNYTGGDTGGGNATLTYSYQTFNDFTYTAPTGGGFNYSTDIYESDATFPIT